MKHCLPLWLLFLLLLHMPGVARATAGPPATGRSLAEALNPDGTLRAGAAGSFDARQFRMGTAPDGRPVFRPAGALGAGDARWADGFGVRNGTDGNVQVVVQSGTDIYIGGPFAVVGNTPANRVAKWNGTSWSALGSGLNEVVHALVVAGNGDVYVGGAFTAAGGAAANHVARWNGTSWSALGSGLNAGMYGDVYELVLAGNGDLYAGGFFTTAGGVAANNVARWNGTAWSPLGTGTSNGVGSTVFALALASNGEVYVGGEFTTAGGAAANRVARWNGTSWSPLGTGVSNGPNDYVFALALASNGNVYIGGQFTAAGGVAASNVARWNGTSWSPLGTGTSNGTNFFVQALALASNGDVYVGGAFTTAGGAAANRVAHWNGMSWSPLGTGTSNGMNDNVYALTVASNGEVYVGGQFTTAGGTIANRVARWNGTAWNPLGSSLDNGINDGLFAVAVAGNGDVYVGGYFTQVGGVLANRIAKWNGNAWSALGAGANNGANNTVYALAVAGNGDVYAGGAFSTVGGMAAGRVARWNGTAWSALGTGTANGVNNTVHALAAAGNGDVYVGGLFTTAGGVAASNVAKWNGTAWASLGTGLTGGAPPAAVWALAVAGNGDVFAGGNFTTAGGTGASAVARWNGTAWSPLGAGITANGTAGIVYTLAITSTGELYAGGQFDAAGGVAASNVAKWNGTGWNPLMSGVAYEVYALAAAGNGDVYIGGNIYVAGGKGVNFLTKWNGTTVSSPGTGLNNVVYCLAVGASGKLFAGGNFTATGDGSKTLAHFGIYDPAAPLATAAAKATPAAQLFPNPAHGTATLRQPATAPRQPLTLRDALGRLVRQYPAPAGPEAVLDLRGLPAGVYLVRCGALTQRLVVE